jgi:hypothetical protein
MASDDKDLIDIWHDMEEEDVRQFYKEWEEWIESVEGDEEWWQQLDEEIQSLGLYSDEGE